MLLQAVRQSGRQAVKERPLKKDQMRSGTVRGGLAASVREWLRAGAEDVEEANVATATAGCSITSVAGTGRAASIVGQSLVSIAEIFVRSLDGS